MNTEEQTMSKPKLEEKVKNRKRVAQGKRLAEISRVSKARKKAANAAKAQQEDETSVFPQLPDLSTSMTIIGVTTGVIGTYIAWKNLKQDQVKNLKQDQVKNTLPPPPPSSKIKYNNLDDDDI